MTVRASYPFTAGYSLQIEEVYGQYYVGVARTGKDAHYLSFKKSHPFSTYGDAMREANRLWPEMVHHGLEAFTPRPTLIKPDDLAGLHPRQREVLALVPRRHRRVVLNRAHLLQNLTGGNLSGNLHVAAQEYRAIGAHALEQRSRADNHAAMASCARKGCTACAKSVGEVK